MKKICIFTIFLFVSSLSFAQMSAQTLMNEFLLPAQGKLFRGFDFTSYDNDILDTENSRTGVTFSYDEYDEELYYYLGFDLDFGGNNYALVDYSLDLVGLYDVYAEIFPESDDLALALFNALVKYYTQQLGPGELDEYGYTVFYGSYLGDPYEIYLFLDEDEYGKFVNYELFYSGEY